MINRDESVDRRYMYLCVLDFEATCNDAHHSQLAPREIIEFPSVLLQFENENIVQVVSEFQQYIKTEESQVTPYCERLTGISQEKLNEKGVSFEEALQKHTQWLVDQIKLQFKLNGVNDDESESESGTGDEEDSEEESELDIEGMLHDLVIPVTVGNWDLLTMFNNQLSISGVDQKEMSVQHLQKWINLKDTFTDFYHHDVTGMKSMLKQLGLSHEGVYHSGLDDCRNVVHIVQQMAKEGCNFAPTCIYDPENDRYIEQHIQPTIPNSNFRHFRHRPGRFITTVKPEKKTRKEKMMMNRKHLTDESLYGKKRRNKIKASWNKRQSFI
jgi:inhibitor of KinA sporulation pathway (predicted exonuclease)